MPRPSKNLKARKQCIEKARKTKQEKRELSHALPTLPASTSRAHTAANPTSAEKRKKLFKEKVNETVDKENCVISYTQMQEISKVMFCHKCNQKSVGVKFIHHQLDVSAKFVCTVMNVIT